MSCIYVPYPARAEEDKDISLVPKTFIRVSMVPQEHIVCFPPNFSKSSLHYDTDLLGMVGKRQRGTEQENRVKLASVSVVCHIPRDAFPWLPRTDPPPNPGSRWAEPPVALSPAVEGNSVTATLPALPNWALAR